VSLPISIEQQSI